MKNFFTVIFFALSVAVSLSSCKTTEPAVTTEVNSAYQTLEGMTFYTKAEAETEGLRIPKGINEAHFTKLPVGSLPAFRQDNESGSDRMPEGVFTEMKRDFETMLSGVGRFPVAAFQHSLADKDLQQAHQRGMVNSPEFDPSKMKKGEVTLNITLKFEIPKIERGGYRKTSFKVQWNCVPMFAESHGEVAWWKAKVIQAQQDVEQKIDFEGNTLDGMNLDSPEERAMFFKNANQKAQILFVQWLYECFPTGGKVTEIDLDENKAAVNASRATGLQDKMEVVIYAKKKEGNLRYALFNATATPSNEGSSDLEIWRTSEKKGKTAQIIAAIKENPEVAEGVMTDDGTYEIWAVAKGLAEVPEFLKVKNSSR